MCVPIYICVLIINSIKMIISNQLNRIVTIVNRFESIRGYGESSQP